MINLDTTTGFPRATFLATGVGVAAGVGDDVGVGIGVDVRVADGAWVGVTGVCVTGAMG